MKRALALFIPFLSTDRRRKQDDRQARQTSDRGARHRIRRDEGGPNEPIHERVDATPLVTIAPDGQTLRVVHGNRAALRSGIRPGQTLADARAIVPQLVTCEDDPVADRAALESLAAWAHKLSPVVHIEGDDTLILDVTGCERLFAGEPRLLQQAMAGINGQAFGCRGAIADTLGAAWALAHTHPESSVVAAPGQTVADIGPLPVRSLRIDGRTVDTLRTIGIETVASLLHMPRSSLASRFGEALLERIDQAMGDQPEVWTPYRPPSALASRIEFGAATTRRDILAEGVDAALAKFCVQLDRLTRGVRALCVTFHCPDTSSEHGSTARTVTQELQLSQPTRSARRLGKLLHTLLDRVRLPAPAEALTVWSRNTEPLNDRQDELFSTEAHDDRALSELFDRLAVRLGRHAVSRVEPLSDHQPERAFRYVSRVGTDGRHEGEQKRESDNANSASFRNIAVTPSDTPRAVRSSLGITRPLRLALRPMEASVTAVVPDGPPIAVRTSHARQTVVHCVGPERIETGWWRGAYLQRDYYRVTTESGERLWMFRDRVTERWFLHGWFD